MSNRRRPKMLARPKHKAQKCPKCQAKMDTREYDDAFLDICTRCKFPVRRKK